MPSQRRKSLAMAPLLPWKNPQWIKWLENFGRTADVKGSVEANSGTPGNVATARTGQFGSAIPGPVSWQTRT